jgi:hypothetical protein
MVTGVVIVPLFFLLLYSPFWFARRRDDDSVRPMSASLRSH